MSIAASAEDTGHASQALARMATQIEGMDVRTLATVLVKSGYFSDTREIAQAVVKVLAGRELGFGPIASMQGVYIVKGRVSLAANMVAAAIQRSRRFRYRVVKLDKTGCELRFFERFGQSDWEQIGESSFTPDDAKTAGLDKGDNYQHFPRNMFFARALTNGARWYCPEVFNGPVYTPDELGADVDDDGRVIDLPSAPPRADSEARQHASQYDDIYGGEADPPLVTTARGDQVNTATGEIVEDRPAEPFPPAGQQRRSGSDGQSDPERRPSQADLWQRNRELVNRAAELHLTGVPTLNNRSHEDVIAQANEDLDGRIRAYEAGLNSEPEPKQEAF